MPKLRSTDWDPEEGPDIQHDANVGSGNEPSVFQWTSRTATRQCNVLAVLPSFREQNADMQRWMPVSLPVEPGKAIGMLRVSRAKRRA